MCIKHKQQERACLLLLKGEHDDNLEWPINLTYKLVIGYGNSSQSSSISGNALPTFESFRALRQEFHFNLYGYTSDLSRVTLDESSRELFEIGLPTVVFKENIIYVNVTLKYIRTHIRVGQQHPHSNEAPVQAEMSSTLEVAQNSFRKHCLHCQTVLQCSSNFCPICGGRLVKYGT